MAKFQAFPFKENNERVINERLRAQLEMERATFLPTWREIGDYVLNRRLRLFTADVNRGDRRSAKIVDSTATDAAGILRSGMMSGISSPARPWKRLTTPDPDLAESPKVKDWLYTVNSRMDSTFARSNLYNVLPITYGDVSNFATAAMSLEEDFDDVIRCQSFPIGSYMISRNYRGQIDTIVRDFRMTVRQLLEQFGDRDANGNPDWSNFSSFVKACYDRADYEMWVDICHVVKPNPDYRPHSPLSRHKRYRSVYYERGYSNSGSINYLTDIDGSTMLRVSGYDYFPMLVPRWEVTGEDSWGTMCPGIATLPDNKQLQLLERRYLQAVEKKINPPMTGPTSLRNQKTSILPGDTTFVNTRDGQQGFRAAHEVNISLAELQLKTQETRERIKKGYFENLFLAFANQERGDITAREVDEVHEEKLLALGPVYQQLNVDLFDPLISNTFQMMVARSDFAKGIGPIPPPPDELQGLDLKIEYISVMAQAQKAVGIQSIERFVAFAGQLAAAHPEVADKVDLDQTIDVYGEMMSVPPGIIRPDDKVAEIRTQRAKAQQAASMVDTLAKGAGAAKDLSAAKTSGDNALAQMLEQSNAGSMMPAQ